MVNKGFIVLDFVRRFDESADTYRVRSFLLFVSVITVPTRRRNRFCCCALLDYMCSFFFNRILAYVVFGSRVVGCWFLNSVVFTQFDCSCYLRVTQVVVVCTST